VKDEQVALLRQSISVMEEELLAKDGRVSATAEKHALLQRECAARDEQIMVLSEKLQAAQLEAKVVGSQLGRKNEHLALELESAKVTLAQAQQRGNLEAAPHATTGATPNQALGVIDGGRQSVDATVRWFHNTCLLVKVLLAAQSNAKLNNIPIDDLYRDVVAKAVPVDSWPNYIYEQFTS